MNNRRFFHLICAIAFAVFLSLAAYVVYLLVTNYRSQTELRANMISRLKQDTEIRAASIGYFFSERIDDVLNASISNRTDGYFENKALGMSKEYGLNISLIQIRQLFIDLMKRKQVGSNRMYSRIVLIDRDGSVLVDVSDNDKQLYGSRKWKALLAPAVRQGIIAVSHDRKELMVSIPCYHKDKFAGQIVAWINPEVIAGLLVDVRSTDANLLFIALQERDILQPVVATHSFKTQDLPEIRSLRAGEVREFGTGSGGNINRKIIALRVPVNGTPFSLVHILAEKDVVGDVNPDRLLINMVIQAVVIFAGLFFTLGLMARYLTLQTRLDVSAIRERELGEKNRQLEIEILERNRAERALLEAMEASEAANRAKTLFLSNMSHEVRTPMSGILGLAGLLLETPLTEKQRDYAEKIRKSGEQLLVILTNVLDYARMNAGKITIVSEPFSIAEAIEEVVRTFGPLIAEKGLKLDTVLDGKIPSVLVGDNRRVIQMIGNLMDNAIKFTEKGEIRLSVRIGGRTEERVDLEISVEDTGVGIREGDLPGLFAPFTQADDSMTRRYGGSGMGLAISRSLVELMGGMLRAESSPGKGSAFTAIISFPVATDGKTNTYAHMDVKANLAASGLDVEKGMKHFDGNEELYLQSLSDFLVGHGETPSLLMKELRADRRDEAILVIQAIRTVAGKLGGNELAMVAAELEEACREAADGVPFALGKSLRVFIDHYEAFVATIMAFISQQPFSAPVKPDGPLGNVSELIPLLAKLRISLENEEPRPAKEILATLLKKRWSESHETVLTELSRLVKRYRLAEALELLNKEFSDVVREKGAIRL